MFLLPILGYVSFYFRKVASGKKNFSLTFLPISIIRDYRRNTSKTIYIIISKGNIFCKSRWVHSQRIQSAIKRINTKGSGVHWKYLFLARPDWVRYFRTDADKRWIMNPFHCVFSRSSSLSLSLPSFLWIFFGLNQLEKRWRCNKKLGNFRVQKKFWFSNIFFLPSLSLTVHPTRSWSLCNFPLR